MFTIIKTVSGVWYHLFNNGATKVHLSDFDVIIDAIAETYVIEAKNGSNIPSKAISISDIRVIDDSVSTTIPLAFSGATGLIELLTSLGYPPYLSNAPSQPPVKIYTKGQTAFFTNITQAWIDANFDNTGLGILEAIGWEKVPQLDGKVPIGQTTGGLFDNIGNSYGFANTVLPAHEADSAVFSDGKKGVNTLGTGATVSGYVLVEDAVTAKTVKTSKVGQDHTGAPSTVETGANKNYQPSLIVLYVRRTEDLWITGGSSTSITPNLTQVLAIDNKTNDIPIVSNNGNGYAYVNDEQTVIGNDFGGTKKITMNEDSFAIETNVRATIDGKGLHLGTTTDGFLMPRVTTSQMNAIDVLLLSESLLVYNTTESKFYKYDGTDWVVFGESSGSGTLPYQELIFTAVQTAPQTGINSGSLIEGGKYTITDSDITTDFVISGAADNTPGTIFIANATPPDWGVSGELSFEGNPIFTVLNNPTGDNFIGDFINDGDFILQSDADTFAGVCFPTEFTNYTEYHILGNEAAEFPQIYMIYYKLTNNKYALKTSVSGGLANNILDGTQLITIKIFNP